MTPLRSIRVPTELWLAVAKKASDAGTNTSAVIVKALREYLKE
jgi:hypothetical protein|tara:strand:- start:5773 stop:5901 length:129 start_codon:yes stop_codon:yes gene_type:complete